MVEITFAHISDAHMGIEDPDGEQERLLDGVLNAIKEYGPALDFIVFSGDITQDSQPSQYQQAQDWLTALSKSAGGCPVIICPGNHDVDRKAADVDQLRLAHPTKDSFDRSKKNIYQSHNHLKPFFAWFEEARENSPIIGAWGSNPFSDCVDIGTVPVPTSIICLNTAALSCGNGEEEKLCVDTQNINSFLHERRTSDALKIAVAHHPFHWLSKWNSEAVSQILSQETGVHIFLHGHVHEDGGESGYSNLGAGLVVLGAGAAYQGSRWPQSFSVVKVSLADKQVTPTIFRYNGGSGKWLPDASSSRPIPARLPHAPSAVAQTIQNTVSLPTPFIASKKWKNPFDLVAANDIPPHVIPTLFVDRNNAITAVSNAFDAIVEGQRGTGKTMLLRYLSIDVQSLTVGWDQLAFLGVYTRLSSAGFNRSDLELVIAPARREALFLHRLCAFLLSNVFIQIGPLLQKVPFADGRRLRQRLSDALRDNELMSAKSWKYFTEGLCDRCDDLIEKVDEHTASMLPGGYPIEFNPWLSLSHHFLGVLKALKSLLGASVPFFLLLDDFDALNAEQQSTIFKTAAERNHALVCFKFGIMQFGQKTNLAGAGRTYREGDDYDLIPLNWVDKGLKGERGGADYKDAVIEIAQKRISVSDWPKDFTFNSLFNYWIHGKKIRDEVKAAAKKEYDELPVGRTNESFSSFWAKQGYAKYFRYLKAKKIEHRYAGPDTIVEVSSGIFRQFLEICSRIVSHALDSGWTPEDVKKIGPDIQNFAIRKYSNDMIRSLGESSGDLSALGHEGVEVTGQHLVNLVESLTSFFSYKLYSASKDAEVIAIAIKDAGSGASPFGRALLDVAVRESVLQRRILDYSSKTEDGLRLPTYILNRRLAPRAGLPMKLQGRHEVSLADVEMAARDPGEFKRVFCKTRVRQTDSQGRLL